MLSRNARTTFLLVLIGAIGIGCGTVNPSARAPLAIERAALSFRPEPGRAVLYLYKPRDGTQIAVNSSFRINKRHLGEFGVGYFRIALQPGKHRLIAINYADSEADWLAGRPVSGGVRDLVIHVKAGEVVFVRSDFWDAAMYIVNARQGKSAVNNLKLYQGDFSTMDSVYQTKEDMAWEACAQTKISCQQFLAKYPKSAYRSRALQAIKDHEQAEVIAKLKQQEGRDSALPAEVRRDKYMVALTAHLKNERFEEALVYFDRLQRLGVKLSPSFNFFYGESLLRTGDPDGAISKLYAYISEAGSGGQYYKRALELVNEAESIEAQ